MSAVYQDGQLTKAQTKKGAFRVKLGNNVSRVHQSVNTKHETRLTIPF